MNNLKEELEKLILLSYKLGNDTDKDFILDVEKLSKPTLDWINQNYISKDEILGLEELKEVELFKDGYDNLHFYANEIENRNQLRNEIKERIKKL